MTQKYNIAMYLRKKTQLFLLHFAGGNCYSFNFLKKYLAARFDFHPLELPGRGLRSEEAVLYNRQAAIEDYFQQIKSLRNQQPYLVYGHSMGATLGLSVTKKMEAIRDLPEALIVSGNPGPGAGKEKERRYLLADDDFKESLRKLGGVPEEVLQNKDLYDFFSPVMRADFEILEKEEQHIEKDILLQTPICAIMGGEEESMDQIENWQRFTTAKIATKIFPGNHFFIYDNAEALAKTIYDCFQKDLRGVFPTYF